MALYIARRLLWAGLVILVVLMIVFAVFYLLPASDPALRFAGKSPTPESLALIRDRLGLDEPWWKQYAIFVKNFVAGDEYGWPGLGYSFTGNVSVLSEVTERAPRTLFLIAGAAIIWLVVGVSIGVLSAVKRQSAADRAAMGFVLIGISSPVFWLGLMALWVFWKKLGWTGGTGYVPITESPTAFFSHMILPWTVLALLFAAIYARMTRNSLLDTLGEDYIRTARAKGLPERTVIFRHGLRASLAPIITMFGMDIALLVGGAIITESVFNIQGLGWLAIDSTLNQDLPTVVGVVVVGAVAVVVMNLIVDIGYAFLDPRVRYE
ncbi:MAG TPA: ABC transporter permease [Gaiellaceae bacterium]|jgi:peptide/nickel transport system permease protein|nr:ABC transporter permease [Gaiellaceae bacterium]